MADYTKQSPGAAALSQYHKDVATLGYDAAHAKLMADVDKTTAETNRLMGKTTATLEANDPGSTTHSDGRPTVDPGISNNHKSPF